MHSDSWQRNSPHGGLQSACLLAAVCRAGVTARPPGAKYLNLVLCAANSPPPEPSPLAGEGSGGGLRYRRRFYGAQCLAAFVLAWLSIAVPLAAAAADSLQTQHRYPVLRKFWRFLDVELQQKHLTGNWGGRRHALERVGVTLTSTYTTDLLGNPLGGNQQGFRYAGDMGVDIRFDLERLLALKGLVLDVIGSWHSGENLSAKDIGNTFTASQIFGGETVRLYALALEWASLWDNRLDIRAGRIGAGDDFLASPWYTAFVNSAFNGTPGSVPTNIPSFIGLCWAAPDGTAAFMSRSTASAPRHERQCRPGKTFNQPKGEIEARSHSARSDYIAVVHDARFNDLRARGPLNSPIFRQSYPPIVCYFVTSYSRQGIYVVLAFSRRVHA
jgi:Carbohydrate-selective porin, OprB family